MKISTAIKAFLRAHADITAIVGQKVHKRRAPQRAGFPYVIISVSSTSFPGRSQDRRADGVTQTAKTNLTIESYSKDEDECDTLAETVAEVLDDLRDTAGGLTVKRIFLNDERDDYFTLDDGSDVGAHRIMQDYTIWHDEPIAA